MYAYSIKDELKGNNNKSQNINQGSEGLNMKNESTNKKPTTEDKN